MADLRKVMGIAGWTLTSRVAGLGRDVLIANYMGTSIVADAFVVAFKLPNFARRLMMDGAIAAAVVPVLGPLPADRRHRIAGQAFLIFGVFLLVVTGLLMLMPATLVTLLTGGFPDRPQVFALATDFTRYTLPYVGFAGLASLCAGYLNAAHRFTAAAATPLVLNIALLSALLIWDGDGAALSHAVSIGGALQLLLAFAAAGRAGLIRLPRFPILAETRHIFGLMLPAVLTAGLGQINLLIDMMIAARLLPEGSLSVLFFADRLYTLPAGIAGVAIGTAMLPKLSADLAAGSDGRQSLSRALEFALLLTLPAAAGIYLVASPVVALIYGHGAFDARAVALTADTLRAYAFAVPLVALVRIFTAVCHAGRDMRTPLMIAIALIGLNIGSDFLLARAFGVAGIGMTTSLIAGTGSLALGIAVWRKGILRPDRLARRRILKAFSAVLAMAAAVHALQFATDNALILVGVGVGVYVATLCLLQVYDRPELKALLARS